MEILRTVIHYGLHLLFPGVLAWVFFRKEWKKAWLIMIATMVVDADHVFACREFIQNTWTSIADAGIIFSCPDLFVADRCSIGFHPLHSQVAIGVYVLMLFVPVLRIVAVGLLLHMATDYQDCLWM